MSLDRFISSVRAEVAKRFDLKTDAEIDAFFIGMKESAKDNQEALEKRDKMLRDTFEELYDVKRLLKSAAKIAKNLPCNDDNCSECVHNDNGHILCELLLLCIKMYYNLFNNYNIIQKCFKYIDKLTIIC